MTAADQIVRSVKKVLAMEGRPHMGARMYGRPFLPFIRFSVADLPHRVAKRIEAT